MILGKDNVERLPPPVGTSDWATFSRDSYCVDKTLLIKELIAAVGDRPLGDICRDEGRFAVRPARPHGRRHVRPGDERRALGRGSGAEGYTRAEANGPGLWDGRQDGGRWKFYRLGLSGHNTLTLDGCDQQVKAFARLESLTEGSCSTATYDLTPLYTNASRVVRSGEMLPDGGYRLRDRVEGLRPGGTVRWTMHTRAKAERTDGGVLLADGKTGRRLRLSVTGVKANWEIVKNPHPSPWDSENRNVTRLTFDVTMPAEGAVDFAVTFAEPLGGCRSERPRAARETLLRPKSVLGPVPVRVPGPVPVFGSCFCPFRISPESLANLERISRLL